MLKVPPVEATPRTRSSLLALVICIAAASTLLWPLFSGQILFGGQSSDMYLAGYAFRKFGADTFLATGKIPQWNPFLFGGLPYIGAMHGDIFYPTAWLRWIMPVDLAITWGMVVHFVLAGWLMYRFVAELGARWGAAVTAGVSYELSGILASQMSPGHDGKLFVSALAPLGFWVLLRIFRSRDRWGYPAFACVVALGVLGHYHMAYFLFLALALWGLYLAFLDESRPARPQAIKSLALCIGASALGFGITALQVLPFLSYIPYSPRAAGGPSTGWEFANTYSFPPNELLTVLLPEFNGMLDRYWGTNPLKLHTEYLGVLPLVLASFAIGDAQRRRLVLALVLGALIFLLFAFAGHTPFYRPFFELLPGLKKIRAMGMVFYLVAFFIAALTGLGAERILARLVPTRTLLIVFGSVAIVGILGVSGALQAVAESIAIPERASGVVANAESLRIGAVRLLLVTLVSALAIAAIASDRVRGRFASVMLALVIILDLWSVDRNFYIFSPRANVLFADDDITRYLKDVRLPYRILDAGFAYGRTSILMSYGIPSALGYHGFELRTYDELGGAEQGWANLLTPNVLDLLAIRFLLLPESQTVPGFHKVIGPVRTSTGEPAVLYARDTIPPYARVVRAAAKVPTSQLVPTLIDSRLPVRSVVLFPDTASVSDTVSSPPFVTSRVGASVNNWTPGHIEISLAGADSTSSHLIVSENWYPDWRARVDGKAATVRRANHTLLSVDIPPGAQRVVLDFSSDSYANGKSISAACSIVALVWMLAAVYQSRRRALG